MESLRLSPPWVIYQKKIEALFGEDPGINVVCDTSESAPSVKLYVENDRKAAALSKLLPEDVMFGGVKMGVVVVPGNSSAAADVKFCDIESVVTDAFEGNPVVTQIRPVSKGLFRGLVYVVFRHEVVQFFADRLDDINGFCSTLMESVAREVLVGAKDVFFCTSAGAKLAAPFEQWP